ncbi:EGF-like domain protein [Cooperia oncophora]
MVSLNPQSACNIRCENGGMCAFSFDNPHLHTCICLMGVYEGERCQYEVGVPRTVVQQTQQMPPPPHPTPVVEYDIRRMEIERQREEQRRQLMNGE